MACWLGSYTFQRKLDKMMIGLTKEKMSEKRYFGDVPEERVRKTLQWVFIQIFHCLEHPIVYQKHNIPDKF